MYNSHSIAVHLEHLINAPYQSANEIEQDPLKYLKGLLDREYERSERKKELIDAFDGKYSKCEGVHLREWNPEEASQFVRDLREILTAD